MLIFLFLIFLPTAITMEELITKQNFKYNNTGFNWNNAWKDISYAIENNNFVDNNENANILLFSLFNNWNVNYWDEPQDSPYIIQVKFFLFFIPWFNFDWHPTSEPYEIG